MKIGRFGALGAALTAMLAAACNEDTTNTNPQYTCNLPIQGAVPTDTVRATNGLRYIVVKAGPGSVTAGAGNAVFTCIQGRLTTGQIFQPLAPFEFQLGRGGVIPGFEQGVTGMRVGEIRRVIVPPELGYGATGSGSSVPPNSTLVFDIELLDLR